MENIIAVNERMNRAAKNGFDALRKAIFESAVDNLVQAKWDVTYNPLGHEMILQASVKVASPDFLLQIWMKDERPAPWIPELRPWTASVTEFDPHSITRSAKVGLFD